MSVKGKGMLSRYCLAYIMCLFSFVGVARNISPLDYGFASALTGSERFNILRRTHEAAIKNGFGVTYEGIKRVDLVIPKGAKPIPLSNFTDFAGVEITVTNNETNTYLFSVANTIHPILVKKSKLENGNFTFNRVLRKGVKLLIVVDDNLWVKQRRGYNNGVIRKDVLLLHNGRAINKVVASYLSSLSLPKCYYCDVTEQEITIKNLILTRSKQSVFITRFVELKNLNNVHISNVVINTPEATGLYGESAIRIENSANVTLEDVTINGTYSMKDKYGYGIGMNNVWNSHFVRLKATGNWGVFGNNNVSLAKLENCDINRFDIHCYGKDVYCKNSIFRNLYNQFSSMYGTLRFEGCSFVNFVPVLFDPSYSAYTFFKLEIENCSIDVDEKRSYLINAGNPSLLADAPRSELASAYWPDVSIRNLTVNLPDGTRNWTLFQTNAQEGVSIDGLSNIKIEGLEIKGKAKQPTVRLSNRKVMLKNRLKTKVFKSSIQTIELNQ